MSTCALLQFVAFLCTAHEETGKQIKIMRSITLPGTRNIFLLFQRRTIATLLLNYCRRVAWLSKVDATE
ncbi:MAG: hypothetical protein ACRDE5_00195 [Ginsengibacter sp.]